MDDLTLRRETRARIVFASVNAFAFSAAQVLSIAIYPFLAERLGISLSILIASFGVGTLLFLWGGPYWARRSDRVGREPVIALGLAALFLSFGTIVALVQEPFADPRLNAIALLLSRGVYGLVASAIPPVAQSLHAEVAERRGASERGHSRAMAHHSLSLSLGRVFGLGILVASAGRIETALFVFVVFLAALFVANGVRWVRGATFFSPANATGTSEAAKNGSALSQLARFRFLRGAGPIVGVALAFTAFVETLNSSLGGRISQTFGLDGRDASEWTAHVLLFASIGIAAVQAVGRSFVRTAPRARFAFGVAALGTGAALFGSVDTVLALYAAVAFLVVGIGVLPPVYLTELNFRNRDRARSDGEVVDGLGRRAGLVSAAHTLGYAIGSALAALAFRRLHTPVSPVLITLAASVGILGWIHFARDRSAILTPDGRKFP